MFNIIFKIERWKWNKKADYWVSTEGRIKDSSKQLIKPNINSKGYMHTPHGSVHRLVLETWKPIENPEEMTIDHLNHNKRDNSLANLEWVTAEENFRRAVKDFDKNASSFHIIGDSSKNNLYEATSLVYADSHILNKHFEPSKKLIKFANCEHERLRTTQPKLGKDQRFLYHQINTCTFNKTKPIVVRSSVSGTVRYFSNFNEMINIMRKQLPYLPKHIVKCMRKDDIAFEELMSRIAEGTLSLGYPMVAGLSIYYVPENLTLRKI